MIQTSFPILELKDIAAPVSNAIVDGPFGSNLKVKDYVDDGIPVLQGSNITNNKFQWNKIRYITEQKATELKRSKVVIGDILIVKIGSVGYSAEVTSLNGYPYAIIPANLAKVTVDESKVDKRYLCHWLNSDKVSQYLKNIASKTAQPALSLGKIKSIPLPLPPLDVQKKIATVLDRADRLRQKRKEAIARLDDLVQSVFLDMFGDPVTNSKGWEVKTLGEVTHKITDGVHSKPDYISKGVPFISVKNITTGRLDFNNCKFISEEDHKKYFKRCNPEFHDILYTKVGATYGRPAIVDSTEEFSLYVSVALIKPDRSVVNPYFLREAMANVAVKRQADRGIKGIGVPDLHLNVIREFLIPVPPLSAQDKFLGIVKELHEQRDKQEQSFKSYEYLFNSLLQQAFKGKLNFNDKAFKELEHQN